MSPEEILRKILKDCEAVLTKDHFVYRSGEHGSTYVNKDAFLKRPLVLWLIGALMADKFHCEFMKSRGKLGSIEVVVGPTMGGIKLADRVAERLPGKPLALFAEEETVTMGQISIAFGDEELKWREMVIPTGKRILKRGFDKDVEGRKVLVVEDVLTTGSSARETVEAVRRAKGRVVAVMAVCNRGNVQSKDVGGVPLFALLNIGMTSYPAEDCPLCKAGAAINEDFGHGKEFMAKRQNPQI